MMVKPMSDNLTLAAIHWRKNRRNDRILFGAPERLVRLDWQRSLAAFLPGSVFGYERWEANKFGTQSWLIFVLRAVRPKTKLTHIPGVFPGAQILLRVQGKAACKAFLSHLDSIKAKGEIEEIEPLLWQHISHRIQAGKSAKCLIDRTLERLS